MERYKGKHVFPVDTKTGIILQQEGVHGQGANPCEGLDPKHRPLNQKWVGQNPQIMLY